MGEGMFITDFDGVIRVTEGMHREFSKRLDQ
jgi:hypothetical protein